MAAKGQPDLPRGIVTPRTQARHCWVFYIRRNSTIQTDRRLSNFNLKMAGNHILSSLYVTHSPSLSLTKLLTRTQPTAHDGQGQWPPTAIHTPNIILPTSTELATASLHPLLVAPPSNSSDDLSKAAKVFISQHLGLGCKVVVRKKSSSHRDVEPNSKRIHVGLVRE